MITKKIVHFTVNPRIEEQIAQGKIAVKLRKNQPGYVPMKNPTQSEESIHSQVCQYLKLQYAGVIFNTDLSGVKLSIGQSKKIAKLHSFKGFPDIQIFEPRGDFYGLFLELKSERAKIYKKNGEPYSPHISEQLDMIKKLNQRGYFAVMVVGFEEAKRQIDKYLTQ